MEAPRQRRKVAQQRRTKPGGYALWVELHAIVRQRAVGQSHEQALAAPRAAAA